MKQITLLLITTFLIAGLTTSSQEFTSSAVVGIAKIKPATDDMTNEHFEKFYLEELIPAFNKVFPSVPISLMKKIKGKRMGEYAEFYVFESLKERNRWFPKPGVSSDEAKEGFKKLGETWSKYHEIASSVANTDYLVLPFSRKNINVKAGNVVIVYEGEYTLEDGMSYEELEQLFQKEYVPAIWKNFPGIQYCVFKGERGERIGKYTEFVVFETLEEYHKWWSKKDGKSTDKLKQAFNNMREIQDRMAKMVTLMNTNKYIVL